MARIRTIKPEFFTSEDIVSLSPLARLLYQATWCEADKAGRLVWKPKTFKLRYFPGDSCDIEAMCQELVDAGLVVLYGDGYAFIPSFEKHQHINPRESASTLPSPEQKEPKKERVDDASARVSDGESTVSDAQGGREGKGKSIDASSSRLAKDWVLPSEWGDWCREHRPDLDPKATAEGFRDYWHSRPGKDGRKADWFATWRNWCRNQRQGPAKPPPQGDIWAGAR